MAYHVHRSQRTAHERAMVRANRQQSAGIGNTTGGQTFIHVGGNGKAPTPEEMADAVRFGRGDDAPERQPHTVVRFGPDFSKVLVDVPDNAEPASDLHASTRLGSRHG